MDLVQILQILVQGATQGVVNALLAMGIAIVFRTTRVLNFAHGEVLVTGVFVMYVLVAVVGAPYWVGVLVALAVAALIGLVLQQLAVRAAAWMAALIVILAAGYLFSTKVGPWAWAVAVPLAIVAAVLLGRAHVTGLTGTVGWVLGTIAFATVLQQGMIGLIGASAEPLPIPGPFKDLPVVRPFGVVLPLATVVTAVIGIILVVAVDWLESRTRFGRAMKAVAANENAAALMGIDVRRVVNLAFVLAAVTAVLAGLLATPLTNATVTDGPRFTLLALTGALLGGIGSVRGAALGGFILGMLEITLGEVLKVVDPRLYPLRDALLLVLLVLVLVVRPRGLFAGETGERSG